MKPNLRKKNLIRPALQLKITLVFMATSATLLAVMGYLVVWFLSDESKWAPGNADRVMNEVMPVLINSFLITMAFLVPVTLVVGILATFMIAGPLTGFEKFLRSVLAGEQPRDCQIRAGDELGEFCELLNDVTRPLREGVQGHHEDRSAVDSTPNLAA